MSSGKELVNRMTQNGVNALLDDAVRAALLDRMSDVPLDDDHAEVSVDRAPAELEALRAAPVVRANISAAGRVTPTSRWQGFVDLAVRHCGYGPINHVEYVSDPSDADKNGCTGDIALDGGEWSKNQRPMKGAERPDAGWACSTMVNAVVSAALNIGPRFSRAGGGKVERQLERPSSLGGFKEYVTPLFDGGPVSWEHLLEHPADLGDANIVRIGFRKDGAWRKPSHVVLVLRVGPGQLELVDPATRAPLAPGLYRFGADGYYDDVPDYPAVRDRQPGAYRAYSCRPTTFRPVAGGDNGRAYVHRLVQLLPDGRVPWMHGGVCHLNDICGLRLRLT